MTDFIQRWGLGNSALFKILGKTSSQSKNKRLVAQAMHELYLYLIMQQKDYRNVSVDQLELQLSILDDLNL